MSSIIELFIKKLELKYNLDIHYLIRSNFWIYTRQTITLLGSLLFVMIFTRLSTKEIFGNFNLILSILAVISLFSLPGMNNSILRSVARGYEGSYSIAVRISFLWSLIGVPLLIIIAIYYLYLNTYSLAICFIISSIIFPFIYAPNTYDSFLLGKKRFDLSAFFSIFFTCIYIIIMIILLIFFNNNLVILILGHLIITATITCVLYEFSLKYVDNTETDTNCIPYGFFLSSTNVVGTIAANIDKIVIGIFLGPAELAVYSIGIAIPLRIKDFLKFSISPLTLKLCDDSITGRHIIEILKKILIPIVLLTIIFGIIYWILIGPLILLFFGELYCEAIVYSKILIIMILLSLPATLLGIFVIIKQKTVATILGYHIFPFVKIGVFIGFTYFWGVIGSIWAMNIEWVIQFILIIIGIHRDNKV